jgi:hypothetical protein
MFPTLWDSIAGFLETTDTPFQHVCWTSQHRKRIAQRILEYLPLTLIDHFRNSLQQVAEAGFEIEWRQIMAHEEASFAPILGSSLHALSSIIPGLAEATWAVSVPLRQHGRLVGCGKAAPWIFVGVANLALEVDEDHPMMQGCHEFLVWRELMSGADSSPISTIAGTEGYAAFIENERRAIAVGDRILENGPWRNAHVRWKKTFLHEQ